MNHEHDIGYKYLFGNKRVFLEMLSTFTNVDWIKDIDEDNLQKIEKSFILPDFNEKEADVVYKAHLKGQDVYLYTLFELQSSVDYSMPYRLLQYMNEIWREHIKDVSKNEFKSSNFRLPAIVPIVLYNGRNNWTVPLEFKGYLQMGSLFEEHILNFKYIFLDINRLKPSDLLEKDNLLASIFYLDQKEAGEAKELLKRMNNLTTNLRHLPTEDFVLFKNWVKYILSSQVSSSQSELINKLIDESNQREVSFMISGLEQNLINIRNNAAVITKLLLRGLSAEEISKKLNVSLEEVKEINKVVHESEDI